MFPLQQLSNHLLWLINRNVIDDIVREVNNAAEQLHECEQFFQARSYETLATHTGRVGRPKSQISSEQLEFFWQNGFSTTSIAFMLGVSLQTIRRMFSEFVLLVRSFYTPVTDDQLDETIGHCGRNEGTECLCQQMAPTNRNVYRFPRDGLNTTTDLHKISFTK